MDGKLALDLALDDGVGVVTTPPNDPRHSNKAGKTALVELIQYGLGRHVSSRAAFHFAPIQSQIDTLWLEILCNDRPMTIRRSLQQHSAGVAVFARAFHDDLRGAPSETMSLAMFSEFLLSQLGIPRVEVSQRDGRMVPLSFPTLMRAFVMHQDDSFGAILDKVEPTSRRGDILGLLSGARPTTVYDLERRKGEAIRKAIALEQSYAEVHSFLSAQGIASLEAAQERVRLAQHALDVAVHSRRVEQSRIREGQSERYDIRGGGQRGRTDALRTQLLSLQEQRSDRERDLLGYRQEGGRLRQLIASLEADEGKSRRLHVSSRVLSSFEFDVCPRCMQEVTADMRARERWNRCSLCSRPLTLTSDAVPRTAPAAADIQQQLNEARQMLLECEADATGSERELAALRGEELRLSNALNAETAAFISPAIDIFLSLTERVAASEAQLADASRLVLQAGSLRDIYNEMLLAKRAADEADSALTAAQSEATRRLQDLETAYRDILRDLEFPDVSRVEIDPVSLMPYLDGNLYVHHGTALRGLAVVGFHLALLRLSLYQRTFYPRLLVIDSPAVGDLNPASHDRLLRYIAEIEEGAWEIAGRQLPPWQIILTTRRMVTQLQPYVVCRIKAGEGQMLLRPL